MSEAEKGKRKPMTEETEEERRARKEREHAEKKARKKKEEEERAAAEMKAAKPAGDGEAGEKKKSERPPETEEERKLRKEKERAERKAKEKAAAAAEAAAGSPPATSKPKETEEERKLRKEKERAERKAKEKAAAVAEAAAGSPPATSKPKETEEERKLRKEKERAERKAKEKAAEAAEAGEKPKRKSSQEGANPVRDALVAAIEEENRAAAEEAAVSREAEARNARREQHEDEKESAERREARKREQREERRRRKEQERGASETGGAGGADSAPHDGTGDSVAAALRRQGYRGQFEKDLARATALRRLVDLDDAAAVIMDMAPQTEYDMYIRSFTESGKKLAAVQVPDEEDRVDAAVQVERVKTKNRGGQVPDDLGLYPEQYTNRASFGASAGDDENEAANGNQTAAAASGADEAERSGPTARLAPSADANTLGAFLTRVFPVVSAVLDENLAASEAAGGASAAAAAAEAKSKAVSAAAQGFSSACTTYMFKPMKHRSVLKTRFSPISPRYVAALYGPAAGVAAEEKKVASSSSVGAALEQYPSVLLVWNTFNSAMPERVLVSFAALTCFCFSPSRPHLLYAGAEDGSVCLWDLREPDRNHLHAGRVGGQPVIIRLPSFTTSWQTDNHPTAVCDVSVATSGGALSPSAGAASGSGGDRGQSGNGAGGNANAEQLVSLDVGGRVKFWAVSDAPSRTTAISASEYGLHVFASVRLVLAGTTTALAVTEAEDGDDGAFALQGGGISDDTDDEDSLLGGRGDAGGGSADGAAWLRMPCAACSSGCCLDFFPLDPSQFVVASAGGVRHRNRFGLVTAPAVYGGADASAYTVPKLMMTSQASALCAPCPTCVRYSARDSRVIVAGYGDGTVRLFLREDAVPQLVVPVSAGAAAIAEVRAVSSTPWLTWALDEAGTLYLLDHAHRQQREMPRVVAPLTQPDTGVCLCMDIPAEERTLENAQLAVGFEKGALQVHTVDARKVLAPPAERDEKWL